MKNRIILTFFLLLCIGFGYNNQVFSQPGCPSVYAGPDTNVSCTNSCLDLVAEPFHTGITTTYSVTSIPYNPPYPFNSGNPLFIGIDDTWSSAISLPFNFCFYGNTYNQVVVGTNGIITFDLAQAGGFCGWAFTASIPSAALYNNSIYGAYHDIDPSVCGQIYYDVIGTAPCRTFVFNFNQVCHFQCNNLLTTQQIVLYETTNVIEVYIQDKPTCGTWNSGNALIGIQDPTGATGLTPPGRNTGPWTASNEAWRFTPDGPPNYIVNWYEGANLIASNDTVQVCPTQTTTYTAEVIYTNCDSSTIVVTDDIIVNVTGVPANPTVNHPICTGDDIQFNSANGGVTYNWSGPNGFNSTIQNPSINNSSSTNNGTYSLTMIDTVGCQSTGVIDVYVNPVPTSNFTVNQPVCLGDSLVIINNSSIQPPATFSLFNWSISGPNGFNINFTSNDSSFAQLDSGIYSIQMIAVSDSGCIDTSNLIVRISPPPIANFIAGSLCFQRNVFSDQSTGGTGNYTYQWFLDSDSIVDQTLPAFEYTYPDTSDQWVTLIVTDSLGCVDDTTIFVEVKEGILEPIMPNVLAVSSQNGNDRIDFEVFAPGFNSCINYSLYIYNRWGTLVYEAVNDINNPDLNCNGCFKGFTSSGAQLSPGTYFYVLSGSEGVELNGMITIFE